jgi:hypothetical protein
MLLGLDSRNVVFCYRRNLKVIGNMRIYVRLSDLATQNNASDALNVVTADYPYGLLVQLLQLSGRDWDGMECNSDCEIKLLWLG